MAPTNEEGNKGERQIIMEREKRREEDKGQMVDLVFWEEGEVEWRVELQRHPLRVR